MRATRLAGWLSACILALSVAGPDALAQAPATGNERVLRVASELDFPPFAIVKPDGNPDGFAVELFEEVARLAGLRYRFYAGPWDSIKNDVAEGRADVHTNMAINPERATRHDFTDPHTVTETVLFVRAGTVAPRSLEELRGRSLLVLAGDHVHQWAARQPWATHLVPVKTAGDAMALLDSGRHDGVLLADIVGRSILRDAGLRDIKVADLAFPGAGQRFAFAVRKGDGALLSRLNSGLATARANGAFERLQIEWFYSIEGRAIPLRVLALYAEQVLAVLLALMAALAVWLFLNMRKLGQEHANLQREYRLRAEAEERLAALNAELEEKVAARTAELARALEAAKAADRAKSEFLSNASHELRTPLNSIIGFAELLKDGVPGPLNAKQAQFAADILASGERLLKLVEQILELSRLDSAGGSIAREPVEVAALLEERVAAQRGAAAARGIEFRLEAAPDTGSAVLDPEALRRMLNALIGNAVKFNRDGGEVRVSARRAGGALEVAVSDTGIGIAKEDLAKLFRPLVQLDAGIDRRHGGIGLGLALAKRLAELHGGTIEVESEPGRGSTFTLRLPEEEIG